MILQQLQKDADRLVDLPPSMYDEKPVKWIVRLDGSGRCLGIDPTSGGEGKKDKGKRRLVPFKNRTSGIQPLLLADKPAYTWGLPAEDGRVADAHNQFLALLDRCPTGTENRDVAVIANFLRRRDAGEASIPGPVQPADMQPDELTTFAVEGRFPIDAVVVRRFWAREAGGQEEKGAQGQCLICGLETELVERLPVPLKGIPNGQSSGVALVSANADAFESHGRTAALTSSICGECGERFGKAANELLRNDKTHLRVGPVAYLFWAPEAECDFVELFRDPKPEEVRLLLESARRGKLGLPGDDAPFYATAISAAISRAVFRSWLETTVGAARQNLGRWFELQRLFDLQGEVSPLSIFKLAMSLYRERKDISPRVPAALVHTALNGGPLPRWLLLQAVGRNQADRAVTYPRAALIKAVLCSLEEEDCETMTALNPGHPNPAYHCGRLLAELEEIQRQAALPGRIKATLVDRYYAGASSAPAGIFGLLLPASQNHLGKLRKNNEPAYSRHSRVLEEILDAIPAMVGFPRTLTIQDQALFSLGYYHQRAAERAARREATERKRSQSERSDTDTDETEATDE